MAGILVGRGIELEQVLDVVRQVQDSTRWSVGVAGTM
jgi:hypothetical protein